ncbi:MAG: OmpW family protein [Methylobacteriaceae bacterium]|jgi:outer membrane protein|nr:OmpW family protein [Methylobacteriaceae bacterium]
MSIKHLLLSGAAALIAFPALAADLPAPVAPPIEDIPIWNPWQVRVRAIAVIPDEDAKLKLDSVRLPGADVDASNEIVPELDITYYFTKNIAAELILGTTFHGVDADGTISSLGKIGRTWILPPTLTAQYHFTNFGPNFKPYLGAGVNYTIFYSEKAKAPFTSFKLDNSFGFALQAGVDFMVNEHWGINLDVKKLFLKPDVKATVAGSVVTGDVRLDPWIVGAGVTYKF